MRTHTSAHQADTFRINDAPGFLISADVYRRDAIDRSHYPVFHQMEGARLWDGGKRGEDDLVKRIWRDVERLPKRLDLDVQDSNPTVHPVENPLQGEYHTLDEVEAMAAHLKRTLEGVVVEIFTRARQAAAQTTTAAVSGRNHSNSTYADSSAGMSQQSDELLKMRWVPAYFPFTSPSWELEVFWEGDWLEILGCGIVKQEILIKAGVSSSSSSTISSHHKKGWAFGVGLERIAMLLFSIPDIRLFWSTDSRFLSQFSTITTITTSASRAIHGEDEEDREITGLKRYVPISKHPPCYKDVAFWLPLSDPNLAIVGEENQNESGGKSESVSTTAVTEEGRSGKANASVIAGDVSQVRTGSNEKKPSSVHDNDVMEIVRSVAADSVEDVRLVDTFIHPRTQRTSLCYRINYRRLDRTLTNEEANQLHELVRRRLVQSLGVQLR